jgi:UDP:flavonoid glycosyltransferase YjiC (YdhE family)
MMARCIQLDIECAAICYAAAQVMSLGSEKAKEFCRICADICEQCGNEWASIKRNIVRSVLKHVSNLQKSVVKWHRNLSLNAGESLHSFLI